MVAAPIFFELERAIELVLYVVSRSRHPTFRSVSRIFYFADREHLSRYGSLLSGDSYIATKHGPVPIEISNLLKAAAGHWQPSVSPCYYAIAKDSIKMEGNFRFRALRPANMDLLSVSQRECLDASLRENRSLSFSRLTARSHDTAWTSSDKNEIIDVRAIAKTLRNAKDVLAYLVGAGR